LPSTSKNSKSLTSTESVKFLTRSGIIDLDISSIAFQSNFNMLQFYHAPLIFNKVSINFPPLMPFSERNDRVQLAYMEFLSVSDSNASESHLLLCQNILEIGSLCSIALEDIKQFDAYVAQLKTYYVDYG
ncbi:hypothetical protein A3Q56_00610, partial [Intoshia linei]